MELDVTIKEITFGQSITRIEVPEKLRMKMPTGLGYFDSALGGKGMTPSVVTLVTGDPGAGKTTLNLILADYLAAQKYAVIYNGAEESAFQTKLTSERLRLKAGFGMGQESNIDSLLTKFDKYVNLPANKDKHPVLFVDSLQSMSDGRFDTGRITSKSAEIVLQKLTNYAKKTYCNIFVIGQVSKSGKFAGSNKLKHMVDAHIELTIETDEKSDFFSQRKLFTSKNRFGGCGMLSYLNIHAQGFEETARANIVNM